MQSTSHTIQVRTSLGGYYNHNPNKTNIKKICSETLLKIEPGSVVEDEILVKQAYYTNAKYMYLITCTPVAAGEELTATYNLYDPSMEMDHETDNETKD